MILGDSMLKHIDPEKLVPNSRSENRCDPGARIEHLIETLDQLRGNPDNQDVTDVVIHSGTNNLLGTNDKELSNEIGKALNVAQQAFT